MDSNDNLARKYNVESTAYPLPKKEVTPKEKPKVERKKNVFTRLEKLVMGVLGAGVFGLLIANISMNIHLSSTNRELQDINNQIAETEVVNENLQQNVQELSRYDRVYEIARQNGLELNEENIRNVEQ